MIKKFAWLVSGLKPIGPEGPYGSRLSLYREPVLDLFEVESDSRPEARAQLLEFVKVRKSMGYKRLSCFELRPEVGI